MKTLISLLLAVLFSSQALSQDENLRKRDTDEYYVVIPKGWAFDDTGQNGTKFMMFSPSDGENDSFKENINLIVQDLKANPMSLDDYAELTLTQYVSMGVTVVENVQTANPMRQKFVLSAQQGGFDLRLVQYCWMIDDQAYVLTLTCLKDEQEQYWEAGLKAMDSFKIK